MRTFIIGYGSLINKASLNRTLPSVNDFEPIYLNNYVRSWNAYENKTVSLSTTYLGIEKVLGAQTNGVIFEIERSLLEVLDKREFLYDREKININDIEFLSNKFNISKLDEIWIYITKEAKKPTKSAPIIQSYVDVCLSGCIELELEFKVENFAKNFILETKNWSNYWVNDRVFPRAPHIHQPLAYSIDHILSEHISSFYKSITIE